MSEQPDPTPAATVPDVEAAKALRSILETAEIHPGLVPDTTPAPAWLTFGRMRELDSYIRRLQAELSQWKPLTPEEAEKALDEAEAAPMSDEEIARIVKYATDPANRLTNSESAQLVARVTALQARVAELEAENAELEKRQGDILRCWQDGISELDTPWRRQMAELVGDEEGLRDYHGCGEHSPLPGSPTEGDDGG